MVQAGIFRALAIERVRSGTAFDEALVLEADEIGANRVFVLASGTLSRTTDCIARLRAALGNRFAGLHDSMAAHSPRGDVVAAANAARDSGADLIVTLGGGSVTDGGKMMVLCLANDVRKPADLDKYFTRIGADGRSEQPDMAAPEIRMVAIPTTLSGGEFNLTAGCTDPDRRAKQMFRHTLMVPVAVILDPAVTVHTPEWLWLSTGIRAVDHAVEDLCSISPSGHVDGTAAHALRLLSRGLPRCKADGRDLEARLDCQTGAWLSRWPAAPPASARGPATASAMCWAARRTCRMAIHPASCCPMCCATTRMLTPNARPWSAPRSAGPARMRPISWAN